VIQVVLICMHDYYYDICMHDYLYSICMHDYKLSLCCGHFTLICAQVMPTFLLIRLKNSIS
jgi:hypothetical protein